MKESEIRNIKDAATELGFEIGEENERQIRIHKRADGQVIPIHLRLHDRVIVGSHTLCTLPDNLTEKAIRVLEGHKAGAVELRVFNGKNGNNVAALYRFHNLDRASFGACLDVFLRKIILLKYAFNDAGLRAIIQASVEKLEARKDAAEQSLS